MFYCVEQSTDLRKQRTVIKKFRSKSNLIKWMEKSGDFTYADPESANNYHRTFRYGYEHFGRIDKKDPIFKDRGTSTYPICEADNMATYLRKWGYEVNI